MLRYFITSILTNLFLNVNCEQSFRAVTPNSLVLMGRVFILMQNVMEFSNALTTQTKKIVVSLSVPKFINLFREWNCQGSCVLLNDNFFG